MRSIRQCKFLVSGSVEIEKFLENVRTHFNAFVGPVVKLTGDSGPKGHTEASISNSSLKLGQIPLQILTNTSLCGYQV